MNTNEISRLLQNTDGPCVSITIPTDPVNRKKNYESLEKAIAKTKMLLKKNKAIPNDVANLLLLELERTATPLPETLSEGLAFFVSRTNSCVIPLPFEVQMKIVVDSKFEVRDLLYLKQYGMPYLVVSLSKKGVHLYKGTLNELHEVIDGTFPLLYHDPFEYERASIANSSSSTLKSFEREKSEIAEVRLQAIFKETDVHLREKFLADDEKILIVGTPKMLSLFNRATSLKKRILGKISGSFNVSNFNKLRELSWAAIARARKAEIDGLVNDLRERNGHLAEGFLPSWTAAAQGKGMVLLVEKDLHHRAYMKQPESSVHLQPPKKPYTVIPDAIDELIQKVTSKHGKVIFTDNNQLKDFDRVALLLRY